MEAASATSSTASSVDGRSNSIGGSDFLNRGMFSGQQESLLVGVGGSGGVFSMGNGFGSDSGITGAVNSSSGTSFDLNDFPSLGGGVGVGVGIGAGHGLAAALREQQQILANQQMLQGGNNAGSKGGSNPYMLAIAGTNGNFQIANEDFPALGGGRSQSSTSGLGNGSGLNVTSLLSNNVTLQSDTSMLENGLYGGSLDSGISHLDGGAGLLGGTGLGGLGSLRNTSASQQQPAPSGAASVGAIGSSTVVASASATGNALSGDYGLLGLLGVIRMTDADRNALALGSDLQLLGLNLGTAEQIYGTFASPWSESATSKEPHFQLPMCYYMQPPALKTGHLSKFQLETLFYIFYALPKDVLQAYSAQELYSREWRYHGELKLWFKRAAPSDGVSISSTGSPQYLYFDITSWERRIFNGNMNQNITNGFLSEEDVRVKFPSS